MEAPNQSSDGVITLHALQTGSVRIKTAQRRRKRGGLLRVLSDPTWTDWLPIYAWVIEHPEGIIVVDAGETARTSEPGYFLAGDASYTEAPLCNRTVDGVSPDADVARKTLDTILRYAQDEPTVYLPSHDPEATVRLHRHSHLHTPSDASLA